MSEFKLHCFAESGNAYKAALMLELTEQDWDPLFVDFFNGQTREQSWREQVNEQGEVPVLEHAGQTLTQSALILEYLAEHTGQFGARDAAEKREIWRWMLFDNHKFTAYYAALRFIYCLKESGETDVTRFLRERATAAYRIVDAHLADWHCAGGVRPHRGLEGPNQSAQGVAAPLRPDARRRALTPLGTRATTN